MKYILFLSAVIILFLSACNTVSEEVLGVGNIDPPDSTGFYSTTAAGVTLQYRIDNENLHCILSANTNGWVAVGFNPTSMMEDANFIIGYTQGNNIFLRDDWGTGTTTHASDTSLGGTDNVTEIGGSESNGVTEIEFSIPLNSGDQYDQVLELEQTYTIILARGDTDDYSGYHTAADYSTITLLDGGGGNGGTGNYVMPDTTAYQSRSASGITYYWLVDQDSLRCVVKAPTTGWVGIGFDPVNVMQDADFIMGYVQDSIAYMSDEWGTGTSSHSPDIDLGGSDDIGKFGGFELENETILYFSIPLNSGDIYDKQLITDETYTLILAYGNANNFVGMHVVADFSSFTVSNEPGGGGGSGDYILPDTTLYLSLEAGNSKFYWLVEQDSLKCVIKAPTTGWIGIGFDPESVMQNANFIMGYVQDSIAYMSDEWGVSPSTHTEDTNLGGSYDIGTFGGFDSGSETILYFSIPLNSGDIYDKELIFGQNYPLILAFGSADNFVGMHTEAAFSSFTVDNETGGGDDGITTGGDIAGDDDTEGFSEYSQDEFSFKWKVVGDSLRCMVTANTSGWVAIGFDPDEAMLNADLIIGYVSAGTTYVRDDWGVTEFIHSADIGLGGENNVTRVFGRQSAGSTEIRFTIPLNSGDQYDNVLIPSQSYEIIIAYGENGADDFNSIHQEAEDFEIEL
ncbi:DOMON domain-containing protein [Candidatus Cloacimonadota bacterium]